MKKRIIYILAAGLIAWSSISSFSTALEELEGGSHIADIGEDGTSYVSDFAGQNIEIKLLDSLTSTDAYLVNLTWSPMSFTYLPSSKVWEPEDMHWVNTGGEGSWFRTDNAPATPEDLEDGEFETIEPTIEVNVENRSSRKLKVDFQVGEDPKSLDFESREQVPILDSSGEETGISLDITSGNDILDVPDQVNNSTEDDELLGSYSDIEGYVENYTIALNGSQQIPAGGDSLTIPMTVVFTPVTEE